MKQRRRNLMDRTDHVFRRNGAVNRERARRSGRLATSVCRQDGSNRVRPARRTEHANGAAARAGDLEDVAVERTHLRDARLRQRRRNPASRSTPINRRRRRFATAPVVPTPKNGSSTTSPGALLARRTRANSASGFCVGWAFCPAASFRRSAPEQIGSNQSERICTPSFNSFNAS